MKPFVDSLNLEGKELNGVSDSVGHVISDAISENKKSVTESLSSRHSYYSDQPSYDHYRDK